jgi:hypothetical protein
MLLANAESGKSVAKFKETIAPNKDGKLILPSKYCHEVSVGIVIEQWKNERVTEKTVLSHTLRPYELFGQRIALSHYPMKWPKDLDLLKEKKPLEKLKNTVLAQDEWLPILTVGSEQFIQSSFTDTGDTIDKPLAPLLGGGAQKLGGSIGDILGGGKIGAAPGRQPSSDSHLTAEWIDYEIRSPSRPVEKIRRQIFDLLGAEARAERKISEPSPSNDDAHRLGRGLSLLGQTDILLPVCRLSPDFVQHAVLEGMLMYRTTLPSALRNGLPMDPQSLRKFVGNAANVYAPLYLLATMRDRLSPKGSQTYLSSINILGFHKYSLIDSSGDLSALGAFDIVSNRVAVHRRTQTDAFLVRLEQGIADTCVEALFSQGEERIDNAAEITSRAAAQRIPLVVVRTISDKALTQLKLPKDTLARIKQDLAAGHIVYAPTMPVDSKGRPGIAWWSIDPQSGTTLGIGDQGWGQTANEYVFLIAALVVSESFAFAVAYTGCRKSGGGKKATELAQEFGVPVSEDMVCRLIGFGAAVCAGLKVYTFLVANCGWGGTVTVIGGPVSGGPGVPSVPDAIPKLCGGGKGE